MTQSAKFETLEQLSPHWVLARHLRLDRWVHVHRFPIAALGKSELRRLRENARRLAKLDHPHIPHVLDMCQTEDAYLLVLEAYDGDELSRWMRAEPDLDARKLAGLFEQLADALAHAHQFDVWHGRLGPRCVLLDRQAEPKLARIGLEQLTATGAENEQAWPARDVRAFAGLMGEALDALVQRATDNGRKAIPVDEHARLQTLRTIVARMNDSGGTRVIASMRDVQRELAKWVRKEDAMEEARMLSFTSATDDDVIPPTRSFTRSWLIVGFVALACVAISLLAVSIWPAPASRVASGDASDLPGDRASERATQTRPPRTRRAHAKDTNENISTLANVGVLNTTDAPINMDLDVEADAKLDVGENAEGNAEAAHVVPMAEAPAESPALPFETASESEPRTDRSLNRPEAVDRDALRTIPAHVELPDPSDAADQPLFDLVVDQAQTLDLRLLGGLGASKIGGFRLAPLTADRWQVLYQGRGKESGVAELWWSNNTLWFAWHPDARDSAWANFLRNTIIVVQLGPISRAVSLRAPQVEGWIQVQLHGRDRHPLNIEFLPRLDDVYIEFVAANDGTVTPLGKSATDAEDGRLRLGLDAREESLILVEVISLLDRNRGLQFIPYSRGTTQAAPVELAEGARQRLSQELLLRQQQLGRGKQQLDQLPARARPQARRFLERLEEQIKVATAVAEAYDQASRVSLALRIYRQIDAHQLLLVSLGETPAM